MTSLESIESGLNNLKEAMENGFTGVHKRQDVTNGRIGKAEEKIAMLEVFKALQEQSNSLAKDTKHKVDKIQVGIIVGVATSVILTILNMWR